jgi:hypothetical protein
MVTNNYFVNWKIERNLSCAYMKMSSTSKTSMEPHATKQRHQQSANCISILLSFSLYCKTNWQAHSVAKCQLHINIFLTDQLIEVNLSTVHSVAKPSGTGIFTSIRRPPGFLQHRQAAAAALGPAGRGRRRPTEGGGSAWWREAPGSGRS